MREGETMKGLDWQRLKWKALDIAIVVVALASLKECLL